MCLFEIFHFSCFNSKMRTENEMSDSRFNQIKCGLYKCCSFFGKSNYNERLSDMS